MVSTPSKQDTLVAPSQLERSLGFTQALTIGVGTMIGAGIFALSGIAAGRFGTSAVLSFLMCPIIAITVVLPTLGTRDGG